MTSIKRRPPRLPARDVVAFSDVELDRYLEENRRPNGETIVDVEGLEGLPKDQQDRFIQRLRDRANASDAVKSRPVNLDQVSSRLLGLSAENTSSPQTERRPLRRERIPTPPGPTIGDYREEERDWYNELVSDGGRPWYPIRLLEEVSENPAKHRKMISFWQPGDGWEVFGKQLMRWQDFRNWQIDNRGEHDDEGEFAAHIETQKRAYARYGEAFMISELEDRAKLARKFESFRRKREWRRDTIKEDCDGGFPAYVEAVKRRLARHGFTRTFQLEQDPKRQDKLTTWIEYLNYEYWWYDQYVAKFEHLQPRYDKAWKELVDSKVLRPFETEEFIWDIKSSFQRAGEREAAQKAVKSAKSAAMSALITTQKARDHPQHSNLGPEERKRMLREAQSKLDAANKSLGSVERRNCLVTEFSQKTRSYQIAKENADRHQILLCWILEQIPLIEAELNESKATQGRPDAAAGGRKRRLERDQDDNNPKKRRRNDQRTSFLGSTTPPTQTKTRSRRSRRGDVGDKGSSSKRLKKDGHSLVSQHITSCGTDVTSIMELGVKASKAAVNRPLRTTGASRSSEISQGLRRSARIATRQDPSRITVPSYKGQRSYRKVAQASTPPSALRSRDRNPTSPATKKAAN